MQSTERAEFDEQVKLLFAGFNVPTSTERLEAYWKGASKMSMIEFARCVEAALGEDGPEKLPTAPAMWHIRSKLKARAQGPQQISVATTDATVQEQLCAYALIKLPHLSREAIAKPWSYSYREWRDPARPKGMERCSECVGVSIEDSDGDVFSFKVADMLGDADGYARALRSFKPGARPSREQLDAFAETQRKIAAKFKAMN